MPAPGMCWCHVVISTYNSWLPGDPRGFRTRRHKVHSSDDYRQPPPIGEHRGLHAYSRALGGTAIEVTPAVRGAIGQALVTTLSRHRRRVLAIAVGAYHAHLLTELPLTYSGRRDIMGQCKRASSHAVRHALPGRIWSAGGKFVTINDRR